jgi:hypothetical protein
MVSILYDAILAAVNEVEKEHAFSRGDAMSAAMHFIVETGFCEPGDRADVLMREMNSAFAEAVQSRSSAFQ